MHTISRSASSSLALAASIAPAHRLRRASAAAGPRPTPATSPATSTRSTMPAGTGCGSATIAQAALIFDEVERQHPYSVWARRAQLMSAFNYYAARDHTKSIESARRFLSIHPGNRDAPYALYLIALNYYEQISDVTRDQAITRQALDSLGELVRRYPDTPYADDARLKIDLVRDHLAGKEMEIGRFYQRRRQWLASVIRFRTVVDDYQTTSHAPEALMRLTESYLALGVPRGGAPRGRGARRQLSAARDWYRARLRAGPAPRRPQPRRPRRRPTPPATPADIRRWNDVEVADDLRSHADRPLDPRRRADRHARPRIRAGLGVLTGETGAGKSILLDALGLALGMRADSGLVRAGQAQASVSVAFELPAGPSGAGAARRERPGARAGRAAGHPPHRQGRRRQPRLRQRPAGLGRRCCASSARCWSRSTASMTIAACSTRAAIAPCSTPSAGSTPAPAAAAWARVQRRRGAAGRGARGARGGGARPRLAGPCGRRAATGSRREPGEEEALAGAARRHAGGRAARRRARRDRRPAARARRAALAQLRQAARRLDRIAGRASDCSPRRWPRSTGR